MNIAFAGLRHNHIYVLFDEAKSDTNFKVIGAFEEDTEAKNLATEKGLICNYNSFEELLEDENVDIVALGGCYADRGQMAIKALEKGKHIIADKPLCTYLEELHEIEKLSSENDLLVSCMFTLRFNKKINALKKLVESGALGEINNVYFGGQHPLQYGRRPKWYFEEGKHGGVINDIAIHGIDVLNYALGLEVNTILSARCWNKFAFSEPNFLDSAQFMLTAKNGAGIIADVSYAIPDGIEFDLPYYWQFNIWGTLGTISFSLNEKESYYYVKGKKEANLLEEEDVKISYLADFYNLIKGENKAILPVSDVILSTRKTLEIQKCSL